MDPHFDGVIFSTHAAELARRLRFPIPPFLVLDVRSAVEHRQGHIPGAMPASLAELAQGLPAGAGPHTEFFVVGSDPDDPMVRGASLALRRHGAIRVVELAGGMHAWTQAGLPLEGEAVAA